MSNDEVTELRESLEAAHASQSRQAEQLAELRQLVFFVAEAAYEGGQDEASRMRKIRMLVPHDPWANAGSSERPRIPCCFDEPCWSAVPTAWRKIAPKEK